MEIEDAQFNVITTELEQCLVSIKYNQHYLVVKIFPAF